MFLRLLSSATASESPKSRGELASGDDVSLVAEAGADAGCRGGGMLSIVEPRGWRGGKVPKWPAEKLWWICCCERGGWCDAGCDGGPIRPNGCCCSLD